jgi:hypothetical protein
MGTGILIRTLAPPTAMAIAGTLNLLVIRRKELHQGINVYDNDGNHVGVSQQAAKDGLIKTISVRSFL